MLIIVRCYSVPSVVRFRRMNSRSYVDTSQLDDNRDTVYGVNLEEKDYDENIVQAGRGAAACRARTIYPRDRITRPQKV